MTPGQRTGLWLVLCVAGGGACAFLTLEGAGIPYALVFLGGLVFLARRRDLLAESLGVFGLGFTLVAARFVVPLLAIFSAHGDFATVTYFAAILAVGIGLIAVAIVLRRSSRKSA